MLGGELAAQLEEARLGQHEAHVGRIGLRQQRRDVVRGKGGAQRGLVVPGHDHGLARGGLGHARRGGDPLRGQPGARLGEQAVDVAVVGAGELDQRLAARRGAREPDRAHRRLGPRRGHAQHVDAGHPPGDQLGQLDLARGRRAVAGPQLRGGRDGRDHVGMRVAEDHRAPGADEVDVDVAVHVEDLRPLGPLDEDRVAADRAHRAHGGVDPARQQLRGAAIELRGARVGDRRGQRPCSSSQRLNASVK